MASGGGLSRSSAITARQRSAHRLEVVDGDAHVAQHPVELALDLLHAGGEQGLDPDVHERLVGAGLAGTPQRHQPPLGVALDADDGVDHQLEIGLQAVQRGADRIDQEGHVVVDDLEDRRAVPPAGL